MSSHPADPEQQQSGYVLDAEDTTEMTRLTHQDQLMTKHMGGLFPASFDLSHCHDVLDIACGPGRWVLDVAFTYPHVRARGIDISKIMIAYARTQAKVQGVDNATYQLMDATLPLDFPDDSFDIVNARLIIAFLSRPAWPALVKECRRILRPGGILRLTDVELFTTNKPAVEKMGHMSSQALHKAGRGFSPDGMTFGMTYMLEGFLGEAGFQDIEQQAYAANFSAGTESYDGFCQDIVIMFGLAKPLFLQTGVTTKEEYDETYTLVQAELMQSDFRGIWHFLSVWGRKPS